MQLILIVFFNQKISSAFIFLEQKKTYYKVCSTTLFVFNNILTRPRALFFQCIIIIAIIKIIIIFNNENYKKVRGIFICSVCCYIILSSQIKSQIIDYKNNLKRNKIPVQISLKKLIAVFFSDQLSTQLTKPNPVKISFLRELSENKI